MQDALMTSGPSWLATISSCQPLPPPPPPLSVVIFVTGQEIELKPTSVVQMAIKASTTASVTMLSLVTFANGKKEQILEIKYNCLDNVRITYDTYNIPHITYNKEHEKQRTFKMAANNHNY